MALKDVKANRKPVGEVSTKLEKVLSKDIPVGETIKGYVKRIQQFEGDYGPSYSLVFQYEDGMAVRIYAHGTMKYRITDGDIKEGLYTEITRLPNIKIGKNMGADFKIAQDEDRALEEYESSSAPAPKTPFKSQRAALNAKAKRLDEAN